MKTTQQEQAIVDRAFCAHNATHSVKMYQYTMISANLVERAIAETRERYDELTRLFELQQYDVSIAVDATSYAVVEIDSYVLKISHPDDLDDSDCYLITLWDDHDHVLAETTVDASAHLATVVAEAISLYATNR
jgi:hypothetical protein